MSADHKNTLCSSQSNLDGTRRNEIAVGRYLLHEALTDVAAAIGRREFEGLSLSDDVLDDLYLVLVLILRILLDGSGQDLASSSIPFQDVGLLVEVTHLLHDLVVPQLSAGPVEEPG